MKSMRHIPIHTQLAGSMTDMTMRGGLAGTSVRGPESVSHRRRILIFFIFLWVFTTIFSLFRKIIM